MTENEKKEVEQYIDRAIDKAIAGFKKSRILKEANDVVYAEISDMLFNYYKNDTKASKIREALAEIKDDLYYDVIPLYYREKETIENIAVHMGVDISTIVRNKKRLCLEIYILLY